MIHHISVAAHAPLAAAGFFAELLKGVVAPFPPHPGSFMAFAGDGLGTAVEVYPTGTVMRPAGPAGAQFDQRAANDGASATHFALSVALSPDEAIAAAAARGWTAYECSRGGAFRVIEVWIENAWLVELLPPAFAAEYLTFANQVVSSADPDAAMRAHEETRDAA